MNKTQHSGIRY